MRTVLDWIVGDGRAGLRSRIFGLYVVLIGANLGAWAWAWAAFHDRPVLLGTALLAYTFGLRHAVDADHIAAIDNVTRKLMQAGGRPVSAGFLFSLGHASVVIVAAAALACGTWALQGRFAAVKDVGGIIGTGVSAAFLFCVAIANIAVFVSVLRTFRAVRGGRPFVEEDVDLLLSKRGLVGRLVRPTFRLVTRSWHMYPLGLLFGLGFETATEIGLLGLSAGQASQGLPLSSIMVFPALFTAGMALVDTTDGILMIGAYGWAFVKPLRKLYYNMTITLVSVLVALVIGTIEVLGLLAERLHLEGPLWDRIGNLSDQMGLMGYAIIAIFLVAWGVSTAIYRFNRYDEIEVATG